MNKELIKEVALNESSQFKVNELKDGYMVRLSEEFLRCFEDEVLTTTQFFIDEAKKKFGDDIQIHKNNNTVFIRKENRMINEDKKSDKENKPLNKPMKGDVKKYKVYVKDPSTGNVKKVNFGDKNMEIKRDDPERRKSFRARHKCDTAKDKTTPRYWSCKFWSKKSVTDLLNEVIEPDSVDVSDLHMKDELCPKVWDGDKLKEDVRKVLIKNALEFIKYAKMDGKKFKDITITGSLANYNYTDTSDIDVHILMDFDQISEDKEFVGEYFRNKKNLWAENYPSHVKGHDVELYFQDTSEPHTSTGVYSLMDDKWLTKPIKKMIAIDTANVQLKSAHIMNAIDDLEESKDNVDVVNKVEALMERLKKMRQSGLDKDGEFSTENIVFKILRNSGYIKKLVDLKKNAMSTELTLEGVEMNEGNILDFIKKYKNTGMLTLGLVVGAMASGITAEDLMKTGVGQEMVQKATDFISNEKYKDVINFNDPKVTNVSNDEIQN